jgi:hypothetical protein
MPLFAHGWLTRVTADASMCNCHQCMQESVKEHACTACRACTGYHHLQEQAIQRGMHACLTLAKATCVHGMPDETYYISAPALSEAFWTELCHILFHRTSTIPQ